MNKIGILAVVFALLTTGCVKVQLLPEDAVKNTWNAGKNMYDERKLKKDGGEKREFSIQIGISDYSSRGNAEESCMMSLRDRLESESTKRESVILEERVFIVDGLENNVIECQIVGFVWPAA